MAGEVRTKRLRLDVTEPLRKRFWGRVDRRGEDECWPWMACFRNGYGAIRHQGHVYSAHVVAYVLSTDVNPKNGFVVAHTCDCRECCNPKHLECVTYEKNNRDARERISFYMTRGEHCFNAVLTPDLVREIRRLAKDNGWGEHRVARRLNLKKSTVRNVLSGRTWKHIK